MSGAQKADLREGTAEKHAHESAKERNEETIQGLVQILNLHDISFLDVIVLLIEKSFIRS